MSDMEKRWEIELDKAREKIKLERSKERGLTERFYAATWENWIADTPNKKRAWESARKAWEQNMFFTGKNGTGKTHLAMCLVKDGATHRLFGEIFHEAKCDFKYEQDVIDFYGGRRLLIIDEVGRQNFSDAELKLFFDIIDQRWNYKKPTLLIGNIAIEELTTKLGTAIMDRIKPLIAVPFDWESRR